MKHNLSSLAFLIISFLVCSNASAVDWLVDVKVVEIESSYMPRMVGFDTDRRTAGCSAGWLTWAKPNHDLNKTMHSVLVTALVGKKPVTIVLESGTCNVAHILLKD